MESKPKILVTGGLGNLGSWIISHLSKENYAITVLAKSNRNLTEKINYKLLLCDISNEEDCNLKLQNLSFDYVIHLATNNNFGSFNYTKNALLTNALGTNFLLKALDKSNLKNFIYFSTFQVYGSYEGIINEKTIPTPINDYGLTQFFAEQYLKKVHKTDGIPFTIFRLTNSYGAPKDFNSSKWNLVLNDLSKSAFLNKKIVLQSNGNASRDFIWMGTVVQIVSEILKIDAPNDVFNISSEQNFSILEIAKLVQKVYFETFNTELPILVNTKDANNYREFIVSSQKIRQLIDFEEHQNFEIEIKNIFSLLQKNDA